MDHRAKEFVVHGCYGAFVACLIVLSVTLWWGHLSWPLLVASAGFGFVLSGFLGVPFVESLGSLLRHIW